MKFKPGGAESGPTSRSFSSSSTPAEEEPEPEIREEVGARAQGRLHRYESRAGSLSATRCEGRQQELESAKADWQRSGGGGEATLTSTCRARPTS